MFKPEAHGLRPVGRAYASNSAHVTSDLPIQQHSFSQFFILWSVTCA